MSSNKPFAFVLMPFAAEFDDIYKLGIQAVAAEVGVVAERVDEQIFTETMLERIYRQIDAADFIIADMSGRNPNVFYEVGYAHAKGKLCTLLTRDTDDIPFDLKHHRHLEYGNSIQRLKRKLGPELQWLKAEVARLRSATFLVERRLAIGTLVKEDDWKDNGSLDLVIDIRNPTKRRTPEIEAVYLYTTKHWAFSQGGQECASRIVESDRNRRQHFLTPPVTRLSPDAWAQLKIIGQRTLWCKIGPHAGDRKEEYRINGHVVLEIVTSDGSFLEQINLDVTFDDVPF